MKLDTVLKKVASHESVRSPPLERDLTRLMRGKKRLVDKFAHIRCKVDTRPPTLHLSTPLVLRSAPHALRIQLENMQLLRLIRHNHFARGRVDCRWRALPVGSRQYHATRVDFCARTYAANRQLYRRLTAAVPRLPRTVELDRWWGGILRERARRGPWLLAPPAPVSDPAFDAPPGVSRPRVSLSLRIRGCAALGDLKLELFSEACPLTVAMFLALLPFYVGGCFHRSAHDNAALGALKPELVSKACPITATMFLALLPFYVGGCFHRKVRGLYWSGGASACKTCAFPPENYHFPHSAPGLLTMQVSPDEEVNGIFSITFKPIPQFDLRSVVFGRVIPSRTYEAMRELGAPLSSQPVVEISAATRLAAPRRRARLVKAATKGL